MAGRPTTYTDEMLEIARSYAENSEDYQDPIPTVVGLCAAIKRSKTTVYRWCEESGKEEFRDIVREIEEKQENKLIKGGLSGAYNSVITKLLLSKHGYSDKQQIDHTTDGDAITGLSINFVDPKKGDE